MDPDEAILSRSKDNCSQNSVDSPATVRRSNRVKPRKTRENWPAECTRTADQNQLSRRRSSENPGQQFRSRSRHFLLTLARLKSLEWLHENESNV